MSATVSPRRSHRDQASAPTRGHLPGAAPALFALQPDLRVPCCFLLADRAELVFGDQEGHHVVPVIGFSFQPLTVHPSRASRTLRRTSCLDSIGAVVAHLRLPGRSALTLAPPLSTTNIRARSRRAPATSSPHASHADVRCHYRPRRLKVQIVNGTGAPVPASPVAGPQHRPRGGADLAVAIAVLQSSCRLRFSPPRFLSPPNIPMASPHSPHPLPPHRAHTPP